jgi:hypothetical protein
VFIQSLSKKCVQKSLFSKCKARERKCGELSKKYKS